VPVAKNLTREKPRKQADERSTGLAVASNRKRRHLGLVSLAKQRICAFALPADQSAT